MLMMRIFIGSFFIVSCLQGSISIVYNIRIAETSKMQTVASMFPRPSLGLVTLFGTFRERYNGIKEGAGGGLFTLLYAPEKFYLRVDGAVGHVFSHDHGVNFSQTQADDLLFSAGYSHGKPDKYRLTYSGLVGFPLHKDTSLEAVQFGYGSYGLGGQLDGSFIYGHNTNHSLRGAARFIHFFPRLSPGVVNNVVEQFNFGVGNLADLFIAFHSNIKKPHNTIHKIEAGYNASFFFGAQISPRFDEAITKAGYIRHSFYGIYKYHFLINKIPNLVALALSLGFESAPKYLGNKQIILFWTSWGVNF